MFASTAIVIRGVDERVYGRLVCSEDVWEVGRSEPFLAGLNVDCEILLMKRAIVEGDRWSGHVALPGGKGERGETHLQAACREVFEEVGIDLHSVGDSKWKVVGALETKNMILSPIDRKVLPVHTFVFISPQKEIVMNTNYEVRGTLWVPLKNLISKPFVFRNFTDLLHRPEGYEKSVWTFKNIAFQIFQFPTIPFPDPNDPEEDFNLWGFTLRRVCLFLLLLGYEQKHVFLSNSLSYRFGNRLRTSFWCMSEWVERNKCKL